MTWTLAIVLIAVITAAWLFRKRSTNKASTRSTTAAETNPKDAQPSGGDDPEELDAIEHRDAWDGAFWEAPDPYPVKAHLQIDYVDIAGKSTSRSIITRQADTELYGGLILAFCELRQANRTFRMSRISNCTDIETGESVTDLAAYLWSKYEESPERSIDILATDFVDVLKVLYYVAKADGQYRREEKDIVLSFVRELVRDERITTEMIDKELKLIGVPTMHSFKLAAGRVLSSGQVDPAALSTSCEAIVGTQQAVHPHEKEALAYLEKRRAREGV